MQRKVMLSLAAVAAVVAGSRLGFADVSSGLPVGEMVAAFHVKDITGPSAGTSLCYRCKYGNKPVVGVFARSVDDNLVTLVKELDKRLGEEPKLRAFVTVLTETPDETSAKLKALAEKHKIKHVPLTIFENAAGPEEYKIAKDADVTVLFWVDGKVKANHAFSANKLTEESVASVVKDTSKILTKS